jgi:lysylphosphatidylglycerol synthetase-like protein (DUF2156 family)
MPPSKSIGRKNAPKDAIPALTPLTFVRAGGLANLLAVTAVFISFLAVALVNRDLRFLAAGVWLFLFVTLVVWGSAAAFCVLALTPKWLRRMRGTSRSPSSGKSGLWDHWLDSPELHGR